MNKKKLCAFYVSDIHLITMLLPYINERINESTKILTVFETDISESAKKVINGIQGKKSKNLLKIDWKNKDVEILQKTDIENKIIIIKGKEEYINNANKIINTRKEKCTILNCYDLEENSARIKEILDKHEKVVNTSGEKNPEDVFVGYTRNNENEIMV